MMNTKMASRVGKQALNSQIGEKMTYVFAAKEIAVLEGVANLHETMGLDGVGSIPSVEDRAEEVRTVALAHLDDELDELYFDEYLGVSQPSVAAKYVGMGSDEWQAKRSEWADLIRAKMGDDADPDEYDDEQLSALYIERTFGVPASTFVDDVVGYSKRSALEHIIGRPTEVVEEALQQAAEHYDEEVNDGE